MFDVQNIIHAQWAIAGLCFRVSVRPENVLRRSKTQNYEKVRYTNSLQVNKTCLMMQCKKDQSFLPKGFSQVVERGSDI